MARRSKIIFCLLLAFLYVVVNICPLRAEALPEVMSGSSTLADNIMTYYALSGSAVANTDWINTLYDSFGSSFGTIEELADQGYLVLNDAGMWEPIEQLGQMIENVPAYESLHLNEMFNVSAEEAAQTGGYAAATGGSILAGSLGGVASSGVVPLIGGVTAAYWGGIALGTLVAHGLGLYGKQIANGVSLDTKQSILNKVQNGKSLTSYIAYSSGALGYILAPSNCIVYSYGPVGENSGHDVYQYIGFNLNNNTAECEYITPDNRSRYKNIDPNSYSMITSGFDKPSTYHLPDGTDLSAYKNGLKNGTIEIPSKFSPDMIGENGNLEGNYDPNTGNYSVPDYKPQIDPGTQAGKPLTMEDWLAFANAVNNNNNNINPTPDGNQGLFDDILDLIRTVIPGTDPNPNPDPGGDPYSPPVVTPVPDPTIPDPVPDQQITENPQESENPQQTENPIDTGKPFRLPDLKNKFPFCVPWDIAKIFSKLKVNTRQAPYISWRFNPPNTPIDYTFNLDLEDFEEVAALLRTLELMCFIVGLAFVTRYLIGAN